MLGLGCGEGKGWPCGSGWAAQTSTTWVDGCGHPFGQRRTSNDIIPGWPSPSYRSPEEIKQNHSGEVTEETIQNKPLIKVHSYLLALRDEGHIAQGTNTKTMPR